MDQPQQPRGNFKMNLNFRRSKSPNAAPLTGTISTPEDPEQSFAFSAFEHTDAQGEIYWIGPVDHARSVRHALNNPKQDGTHFIAIRENSNRVFRELHDGTPNPAYAALTPEQQALEDKKPVYWGTWTRTADQPQLKFSAWEREPNRYGPWVSGTTQYPLTKEQAEAWRTGKADAADLSASEPPTPAKTNKSRGSDKGRAG